MQVLEKIPPLISAVYCVDDACPEKTGLYIQEQCRDKRVQVIFHEKNQGVGGAVMTGYRRALAEGAGIIVKIDSDGQMDPALAPDFVMPVAAGKADYTKGNRFYRLDMLEGMPRIRLFGNAALSFLNKFSSGYWSIFDPTNGYTAIHADVLKLLPLEKIDKGYFFESDMLFRLGTVRAVVVDIPHKAIYAEEESQLKIDKIFSSFALGHVRNFLKRIFYNYFLRDFSVASVEWVLGPALLLFSLVFGAAQWAEHAHEETSASAGTVMLAALPVIVGLQLTLSALHFDVQNQPKMPVHKFFKGVP